MTTQGVGDVHNHPRFDPANSPYWEVKANALANLMKLLYTPAQVDAWIDSAPTDEWKSIYETLKQHEQEARQK